MSATYKLGSHEFRSRLIVGSGKYASFDLQREATLASGADMITVALRRVDLQAPKAENLLSYVPEGVTIPALSGAGEHLDMPVANAVHVKADQGTGAAAAAEAEAALADELGELPPEEEGEEAPDEGEEEGEQEA